MIILFHKSPRTQHLKLALILLFKSLCPFNGVYVSSKLTRTRGMDGMTYIKRFVLEITFASQKHISPARHRLNIFNMLRSFVLFLFATFALTAIAIPTESNTNTHGDLKSTLGKRQTTTASRPGPTANSVVGGYYGDWDVYAKKWFPQDLPLESLTHLFYAFAFLTTDGDVQVGDVADIPSMSRI